MAQLDIAARRALCEATRGTGRRWSDDDLVAAVQRLAAGSHLSAQEYDDRKGPGEPCRRTLEMRLGPTWNRVLERCGLPVLRVKRQYRLKYDAARCALALRRCAADVGRPPTVKEYDAWKRERPGQEPSSAHIRVRLGTPDARSWMDALESANVVDIPDQGGRHA